MEVSSDAEGGWAKALPIGLIAGLPTAMFLQVGFVQTLRLRGDKVRPSSFGVVPPGIGYAVVRDSVYWSATQKQVQTPTPTLWENLTCQFMVCVVPLVCDTLSVRVVEPTWKWPTGFVNTVSACCPPMALLGRTAYIPVYNWAYVSAQQRIGFETYYHEAAGLCVGSLAASLVGYPLFIFKTNLLLVQGDKSAFSLKETVEIIKGAISRTSGVSSFGMLRQVGLAATILKVWQGVGPHALANLGPDVACMASARFLYSRLYPAPATDADATQKTAAAP
ncbi:hypothetical protein M885DRAFT_507261 [Pelagophyceae sp. CCMP2097]|nr:hypothetical protein M885DRAFT_507261 [Pelagophyceae sp. CCMP2097]